MLMFDFLVGIVVSLLPSQYREWWNEQLEAAVFSGLLEMTASLALLFVRYIQFVNQAIASMAHFGIGVYANAGETGVMSIGIFLLARFLMSPLTWLLLYFFLEGCARTLDPLVNRKVLPSLVFYGVDWVVRDLHLTFLSKSRVRTPSGELGQLEAMEAIGSADARWKHCK